MPPAITASPPRVTPARAYCTALTSRSPRPLPSRGCGCPRGKNGSLNVCLRAYRYLPDFSCFGLGGRIRSNMVFNRELSIERFLDRCNSLHEVRKAGQRLQRRVGVVLDESAHGL